MLTLIAIYRLVLIFFSSQLLAASSFFSSSAGTKGLPKPGPSHERGTCQREVLLLEVIE